MEDMIWELVWSFFGGVILTAIGFWLTAKKRFNNIENRLDKQEKKICSIEDKYQKGYLPEYLCESCHKGRYSYHNITTRGLLSFENWICDKCGKEAPISWVNRNNIRK